MVPPQVSGAIAHGTRLVDGQSHDTLGACRKSPRTCDVSAFFAVLDEFERLDGAAPPHRFVASTDVR